MLTPPGAPINLSGTRGDGTVTLTWTKPSSSGSSPITHYKYRYATGVYPNISAWTEWTSTEDTDTSITVSSLTNGTEHFFQVRAFNNAGKGPVANNLFITPGIPPGAPVLSATGGNGQVTLNWIPPTYSGTASITHYEYRYAVDFSPGNYNFTKWKSTGSATTSFIVTGLTNGKNHFFQLRAVNGHGLNTRANNVFVTPNNSQ